MTNNNEITTGAEPADLAFMLRCLQSMRDGDFSVRLPCSWVGLAGKAADSFNEIAAANQHTATELKRLGQTVGQQGGTRERWLRLLIVCLSREESKPESFLIDAVINEVLDVFAAKTASQRVRVSGVTRPTE